MPLPYDAGSVAAVLKHYYTPHPRGCLCLLPLQLQELKARLRKKYNRPP